MLGGTFYTFYSFSPGKGLEVHGPSLEGLEEGHETRGHEDRSLIHSARFLGTCYVSDAALNTGDRAATTTARPRPHGLQDLFSFGAPGFLVTLLPRMKR